MAVFASLWTITEKDVLKAAEEPVIIETETKVLDSHEIQHLSVEKITNDYARLALLEVNTQYEYINLEDEDVIHDCENYKWIFEKYNWNIETVISVCEAESNGKKDAVGDGHNPPVSCGLLQIRTLEGRPSCEKLKDPEINIAYAYQLYEDSLAKTGNGWLPWSVCKNGTVNCKM